MFVRSHEADPLSFLEADCGRVGVRKNVLLKWLALITVKAKYL